MNVKTAQRDVRRVYRFGFSGPLVSALVWGGSSLAYQHDLTNLAMTILFIGGMFIFPLSSLILKIMGGPALLPKRHFSTGLAMQTAFIVPVSLLVVIILGSLEPSLFFPAALIVVGAHYLPFISLYGMSYYGVLAGLLVAIGAVAIFVAPVLRDVSGWIGAAIFLISSIVIYVSYKKSIK